MKNILTAVALCLILSGCGNYLTENYSTVPKIDITTKKGTFVIQNKAGKLIIRPSLIEALEMTPLPYIREAAQEFLDKTGKKCLITNQDVVLESFYEFSYSCQ